MKAADNSPNEHANLHVENAQLREQVSLLQQRVQWFEKQLFGRKSEKRILDQDPQQKTLFDWVAAARDAAPATQTITYQRGTGKKQRPEDCLTDAGLRFSDKVPVEVIRLDPPECNAEAADHYDIIDTKVSYKLAQRPASYVVLRYERPVLKKKADASLHSAPMPAQVLDNSLADVSLLVGLMIDKFQYHLPLYRQHQRLQQAGITVARSTLTNLVKKAIDLLQPIVVAQLKHILQSKILAMDETPIKASRQGKGKMKQAWFWPLLGDDNEIVFTYSGSRGRQHIENMLKSEFSGTLLSDGYVAYARYVEQVDTVQAAQCWIHTRRQYIEAEAMAPQDVQYVLDAIGALYRLEQVMAEQSLSGEKKREYRLQHSKAIVDQLFEWCEQQLDRSDLTPSHPLRKAINYTLKRKAELSLFLEEPNLPLDTNHVERALRTIPMGRKNWLFCWTELGAEHVGIIQSLIVTCKLQDIDPWIYLTDVLQRVSIHPNSKIEELTPRRWKETFADNPMTSILDSRRQ